MSALPLALAGQIGQQELGERHSALLVGLGGADVYLLPRLDGILGDGGAATQHVQIADPQTDDLAPAQAAVRQRQHDFGESEFGCRPNRRHDFVGRHVDLMGRALPVEPETDPVEAVRTWLATSNNATPRLLREKAVVGRYPARYRGRVIWDPDADLLEAQRVQRRSN